MFKITYRFLIEATSSDNRAEQKFGKGQGWRLCVFEIAAIDCIECYILHWLLRAQTSRFHTFCAEETIVSWLKLSIKEAWNSAMLEQWPFYSKCWFLINGFNSQTKKLSVLKIFCEHKLLQIWPKYAKTGKLSALESSDF